MRRTHCRADARRELTRRRWTDDDGALLAEMRRLRLTGRTRLRDAVRMLWTARCGVVTGARLNPCRAVPELPELHGRGGPLSGRPLPSGAFRVVFRDAGTATEGTPAWRVTSPHPPWMVTVTRDGDGWLAEAAVLEDGRLQFGWLDCALAWLGHAVPLYGGGPVILPPDPPGLVTEAALARLADVSW